MTSRVVAIFVVLSSPVLTAQVDRRLTLPEIARLVSPDPVFQTRQRELLPESLEEMVPRADLIVLGTVQPLGTYLSPDQRDLYTDYLVTPRRVMLQRVGSGTQLPGQTPPIVVTRWGGRTVIDGVSVTVQDLDAPAFNADEEVLLLLTRGANEKYTLVSDVAGAFSVIGAQIQPRVNHPRHERFRGMALAQLELEISELSR